MARYTITPWKTHDDLLLVREQLYALGSTGDDATSTQRLAIDRVQAWKLRGNLPHAVESTALLLDAILHHQQSQSTTHTAYLSISAFSVRAVYSAAFCRFVTGFCDIGRHKDRGLEPMSMLEIARQIDMPGYFVALRHEATHEELPGIERLVTATKEALEWLWRVYWSRLDEDDVGRSEGDKALNEVTTEALRMFKDFRRWKRGALKAGKQSTAKQNGDVGASCNSCVELCKDSETKVQSLASVLVQERLLVPSNRELGSSLDGAFLMWDELLDELSDRLPPFRFALVQSCLDGLTDATRSTKLNHVEKEALLLWTLHLVEAEEILAVKVLKWCCLYPNEWTKRLGESVLKSQNEYAEDWRDLFDASISTDNTTTIKISSQTNGGKLGEHSNLATDDEQVAGWSRAILPLSTPIGTLER